MIILHGFGPAFGLPDASPFCLKADILLQMSGLPFARKRGDMRRAPKGKLPMIVDDGETIADSSFIRFHLESRHGVDLDAGLTSEQRGVAWALEKMLEDQLYWIIVQERWLDGDNFDRGPAAFFKTVPAPVRPFIVAMIKRKIRRNLAGQGIGRYSQAERLVLARRGLDAAAAILGDKPWLMGPEPTGGDAALGAFIVAASCPVFVSPIRTEIEGRPALAAYARRIKQRYFSEAAEVRPAA